MANLNIFVLPTAAATMERKRMPRIFDGHTCHRCHFCIMLEKKFMRQK